MTFEEVEKHLPLAVEQVFQKDERLQSLGIGLTDGEWSFVAIADTLRLSPYGGNREEYPERIEGVRLAVEQNDQDLSSLLRIPFYRSFSVGSDPQEQNRHRQLVCGLQIQNFDDDVREGVTVAGDICVGTLGCFVQWKDKTCLLSNSHVLAHSTKGVLGSDRIFQPGNISENPDPIELIGVLEYYNKLKVTKQPRGKAQAKINYNEFDAGLASLDDENAKHYFQKYLKHHDPTIKLSGGVADVAVGDTVFKVGRTTGMTEGVVFSVGADSAVTYSHGRCFFKNTITIISKDGGVFSSPGDSGSAIVNNAGQVVALLFAGGGRYTIATPIKTIESNLNCRVL